MNALWLDFVYAYWHDPLFGFLANFIGFVLVVVALFLLMPTPYRSRRRFWRANYDARARWQDILKSPDLRPDQREPRA